MLLAQLLAVRLPRRDPAEQPPRVPELLVVAQQPRQQRRGSRAPSRRTAPGGATATSIGAIGADGTVAAQLLGDLADLGDRASPPPMIASARCSASIGRALSPGLAASQQLGLERVGPLDRLAARGARLADQRQVVRGALGLPRLAHRCQRGARAGHRLLAVAGDRRRARAASRDPSSRRRARRCGAGSRSARPAAAPAARAPPGSRISISVTALTPG